MTNIGHHFKDRNRILQIPRYSSTAFSRRIFISIVLASIFILVGCSGSTEINKLEPELSTDIDTYIQQVMDKFDIPGMTIAITKDGENVFTQAYGVRSLNTGERMKSDYLFHMASVSKPFVATAIMQLVEQGKMDLDAPLIDYLPYFELADDRYKDITIRQMLNHTSGMPDVDDYEWDKPQYDDGAAERFVRSLNNEQMVGIPGAHWQYSNMAFDVLGDVIAKVSGQPFETYVKENILDPLGMKDSSFYYPETSEKLRTTPHTWRLIPIVSDIYPYNRPHAPSSTLNASVVDMAKWALANLNRGELDGKRILQSESYDILWDPSSKRDSQRTVGLSWFIGRYRGTPSVYHGGRDTGYTSYLTLLPENQIGLILACNYDMAPLDEISDGVLDILSGREPKVPKLSIAMEFAKVYKQDGLQAAKASYEQLKSEAITEYIFGEREFINLSYYLLYYELVQEAIDLLEFNLELYPYVVDAYNSLGEAYLAAGQNDKALSALQKSLEIDPYNQYTIDLINELEE